MKYIMVFLLFLVNNYLLYFNLSFQTLVLFLIITLIICLIFYTSSVDTNINLFLSLLILFPKKPVNLDSTNQYLGDFLLKVGLVDGISFFEVYLLPLISLMLFLKYISVNKRWDKIFVLGVSFIFCFYIGYMFFLLYGKNQSELSRSPLRILITLLFSSQILAIPALIGLRKELPFYIRRFEYFIIMVNIFMIIELFLALNLLLPPLILRQSIDYREGFRSVFFGYSILAGCFGFLGTFISLLKIFRDKKYIYVLLLLATLVLQFSALDRTPLLASLVAILLMLLYKLKGKFILVALAFSGLGIYYSNDLSFAVQNSKISETKTDGALGTESLFSRFSIQFRYLDGAINNMFLPAGRKSHLVLYDKEIPRNFPMENGVYSLMNSVEITEAHNLAVQLLFEAGLVCFLIYTVIIIFIFKENIYRINIYYLIGFLSLLSYYVNQAIPVYFFFPVLFLIFSITPGAINKYKHNSKLNFTV